MPSSGGQTNSKNNSKASNKASSSSSSSQKNASQASGLSLPSSSKGGTSAATSGSGGLSASPSSNSIASRRTSSRSWLTPTLPFSSSSGKPSPSVLSPANPEDFARSPSSSSNHPEGGAAARLRSMSSSSNLKGKQKADRSMAKSASSTSNIAASPVGDEEAGQADVKVKLDKGKAKEESQTDQQGDTEMTAATPATETKTDDQPATAEEGKDNSTLRPTVSREASSKRLSPASEVAAADRGETRRKTWFGWAGSSTEPPGPAATATSEGKKDLEESNDSAADAKEVDDAMNVDEPEEEQQTPVQEQQGSSEENTRPDLIAPRLPSQAQRDEVRKSSWWSTWRVPTDSETLRKIAEQVSNTSTEQAASKDSEGSESTEASADSNRLLQVSSGLQQAANKYVPQAASSRLSGLWNTLNATEPPPPGQQEPVPEEEATEDSETKPGEAQAEATEGSSASPDPAPGTSAVAGQSGWSRWIPYPYWSKEQQQEQQQQAQEQEAKSTSPESSSKDEEMAPPPLTPAEQVKADALARPDPSEPTTALPVGDGNVSNNASAERGSWYSYFPSVRPSRPTSTAETRDDASMNVDAQSDSKDKSGASQDTAKQVMQSKALAAGNVGAQKAKGLISSARSTVSSVDPAEPKPDPAPATDSPTTPLTGNTAYKVRDRTKKVRPVRPPVPNLVLPSFDDTFGRPPRSLPPPAGMLKRTLSAVNAWLSSKPVDAARLRTAPRAIASGSRQTLANAMDAGAAQAEEAALRLPRSWETMGFRSKADKKGTSGIHKVCIVSLHGWFAQSWASRFMGENRGTSNKFALEMREAVSRHFAQVEGMELNAEAITMMPLSADGTVQVRVDKSFATLIGNKDWVSDLAKADAIIFVAHSQGCPVSATLLARLIEQGFIHPRKTRMALLGMCGIHSGPFEHLRTTVVNSYVNYLETPAAKELFDFSDPKSEVSKKYEAAFRFILNSGTKVVLVASTDDQVVPLHSALFTAANHPSILRALYIHGASFPKLDFLTNMLTFCVAVRNAGLSDHNLLGLLSASVAGSLYGGLGHSLCYDEPKTYDLAVQYLFQATHPLHEPTTKSDEIHPPKLSVETSALMGNSKLNSNPHLLPWSLRGLFEDSAVRATFGDEIGKVLDDFEQWKPSTKTLKELAFRLEPMRSVPRPPKREDELLQAEEAKQSKKKGGAGSDDETASVGTSASKGAAKL